MYFVVVMGAGRKKRFSIKDTLDNVVFNYWQCIFQKYKHTHTDDKYLHRDETNQNRSHAYRTQNICTRLLCMSINIGMRDALEIFVVAKIQKHNGNLFMWLIFQRL